MAMQFVSLFYIAWIALVHGVSAIGLHAASHKRHLLVAPSFSGDNIELHPGLHPQHDGNDLSHLIPALGNELHWSQEGHRPSVHGAKHAHMNTFFNYPTVVLEHSNYVDSVQCKNDLMTVCFTSSTAISTVRKSWAADDMHTINLVTYHSGCGDESGRRRSFFKASHPIFEPLCVKMSVTPSDEQDMIDSGDLSWGTYISPNEKRRDLAKGHVRVLSPISAPVNGTVDLTTNAKALRDFISFETIYANGTDRRNSTAGFHLNKTDHIEDGLDFLSYNGTLTRRSLIERHIDLEKRDLFSWIDKAVTWFVTELVKTFKKVQETIKQTANFIAQLALLSADLIAVAFGAKFERNYHNDISVSYFRGGKASTKPPKIGDIGDGFGLAKTGGYFTIECTKCGIEAEMTVDGELSFSIKEGITKGEVSLVNKEDFNLHAIFGIKLEGKVPKDLTKLSKELGAVPLSPLAIPGIFTLGPQVSVSVAASLALEAEINLLIGGSATIGPGTARLSLVDQKRNKLEGFKPSFHPVAEATSGSITATADLGLPIALEVGIDILNGKFKKTVGLVDAPSIYLAAQYSKGQGHKCDGGIELRFGAKNRIFLTAFDVQEYTLLDTKIYETGLTCITPSGFSKDAVEPGENVFKDVAKHFGGEQNLATNSTPKLDNVASKLTSKVKGDEGFRIVMDEKETSILVSGTDGYLYLTEKKDDYDLSAPWGSLNITHDILDFDVFGRLLCFDMLLFSQNYYYAVPLRVYDQKAMLRNHKVASLSLLKTENHDFNTYGASISLNLPFGVRGSYFYYPTACKIEGQGLRLFLTAYLVTKDGTARDLSGHQATAATSKALKRAGVRSIKDCRTIKLTSKIQGTAENTAFYGSDGKRACSALVHFAMPTAA